MEFLRPPSLLPTTLPTQAPSQNPTTAPTEVGTQDETSMLIPSTSTSFVSCVYVGLNLLFFLVSQSPTTMPTEAPTQHPTTAPTEVLP